MKRPILLHGLAFACACQIAVAQSDLLPDLFFDADVLQTNQIDTTTIADTVLFRFDSSLPNIGAGELRLVATNVDVGDGRKFVEQHIQLSGGGSRSQIAGGLLYDPATTTMERDNVSDFRIREILPGDGVGGILAQGAKFAVRITSSAVYDNSLPNSPPSNERLIQSGGVHGISVGYTDLYPGWLPFQWVDVTTVPAGQYWLEVEFDPLNDILEEDETNNVTRVKVTLTPPDADGDGLNDIYENNIGTNPDSADSDGDGLSDLREVSLDGIVQEYNPFNPVTNPSGTDTDATAVDTDGDGLTDFEEVGFDGNADDYDPFDPTTNPGGVDTNALVADTDGDGIKDGTEVALGLDPLNAADAEAMPAPGGPLSAAILVLLLLTAAALRRPGNRGA